MAYNTRFFLFATTALLLALNISGRIIPEATADPTNIAARLNGGGLMEKPTSSVASVSLQIPVVLPLLLPLEKFDHIHMWLKRNPTERVTFYRLTDSFRDSFYSDILPKLERSLSLALIHFLPLSGHLKWNPQDPKPHIVVLQQDTVSLTVAESSADFSCIPTKGCVPKLSYALWCPSYQFPLTPHLSCLSRSLSSRTKASPSEPPSTMLPSWTDKRRQNRSIINVPAGLEPKILELMSYLEKGSARSLKLPSFKELNDVVRITLELSQENVDKLKEREPRTSQLTFAYVWTCMVKTRRGEPDRPVRFRYVADFRNRLDPPVPETYLGNCVVSIVLDEYKAKMFLGEDGFVNGVKILSDSVKGCAVQEGLSQYGSSTRKEKRTSRWVHRCYLLAGLTSFGYTGQISGGEDPLIRRLCPFMGTIRFLCRQGGMELVAWRLASL
ncbi:unnamed protein product [Brassica oleracea]|uniref:(rape) hypothetical protein n=1 Tax=Brassica napus TaxID=3708 RepID=A0A816JNK4_BRANA|nr:unnamed protein product [Brassica napus]